MIRPASFDLHLHTCWSYDALADAERYFERAREIGVHTIAITEHHNIDSMEEALAIAANYPDVRLIQAAELTVNTSIGAVDLLCYGLPRHPIGALAEVLEEYRRWQQACGAAKSQGMQSLGVPYTDEARLELLRTYRPERVLARQGATHVKFAFEKQHLQSYAKTPEELAELMKRFRALGVIPKYPAVERVVPAVKAAGGIVVIAHPSGYFLNDDRARMDALREECSLDGVECAHPTISPELTPIYRAYCVENGLVSTAGSDCHINEEIENPPSGCWGYADHHRFASHLGEDRWLEEFLERIDG